MWHRPKPPTIPTELVDLCGDPEHTFGPNVRFRVLAAVCGAVLVLMGVYFFAVGIAAGRAKLPLSDWASGKLAVPLFVLGVVVIIGTILVPLNWVFVCPRGLIRTRGTTWDGLSWAEIDRFEDATLGHKGVTFRQCRLVLKDGTEWGFLADYIADYRGLNDVMRRKMDDLKAIADDPASSDVQTPKPDQPHE